jgi:hypothetical protein
LPESRPIEYVGRLDDGIQHMAFVTGAFPDGYVFNPEKEDWRRIKSWIAVLHLFDAEGNRLQSEARLGGYDIQGRDEAGDKACVLLQEMFAPCRPKGPKRCDIRVNQFLVVLDEITHSLLYQVDQPEENGPVFESVMLQPRDVMFHPPWDSGDWST